MKTVISSAIQGTPRTGQTSYNHIEAKLRRKKKKSEVLFGKSTMLSKEMAKQITESR